MPRSDTLIERIFSIKNDSLHRKITILGFKFLVKSHKRVKLVKQAKEIQNAYNLELLKQAKELHVFIVPAKSNITGGVISIYQFCKIMRSVSPSAVVLIATPPGQITHAHNNTFKNEEKVYRFEQVVQSSYKVENCTIHLPECMVQGFEAELSNDEKEKLKQIANLQINILNQNILLMPTFEEIAKLYKITNNIVLSTGFEKYSTQEVCDKYRLPLYPIRSFVDLEECVSKEFCDKKKIILYSKDFHPQSDMVLSQLAKSLPDFNFIKIKNLTYQEFLETVADAMFCITFGEGFDGYYIQPYYAHSIGVTVYNKDFFPNKDIQNFPFVYSSYDELAEKLPVDIKETISNPQAYSDCSQKILAFFRKNINKKDKTKEGFLNLINGKYAFYPNNRNQNNA